MPVVPTTGFPVYKKTKWCLYAFTARDKMFKIQMRGTNMNDGLAVDFYITRRMVIKHWENGGERISEEEFKKLYAALTTTVLDKITNS